MNIKGLIKRILGERILGVADCCLLRKSKSSWGGPFNGQTFRQQIFLELIQKIDFSAIAETGTFRGTTTEYLHASSRLPVYSVELQPRFYWYAKTRFCTQRNITLYNGDSRSFLRHLLKVPTFVQKKVFFYLDAHWGDDLPLKEEVQFVFENFPRSVVMIDDFNVPGDEGYGYDDYGNGKVLSLEYLHPVINKLNAAIFFPAKSGDLETGAKRGCVVLTASPELISKIKTANTLVPHLTADLSEKPPAPKHN
jgi:hypothetical protein